MAVVAHAADGAGAVEQVRALAPDILLTDIEMPGLTGIDAARMPTEERSPTRTVIVTTLARPGYLTRARAAGVRNSLSEGAAKLGASNRIEAGRIARRNGWP